MKRYKAFTLIEILVVLGIITALIAILLPALTTARAHAATARINLDLQTIVTAMSAYQQDYGDIPRDMPNGPEKDHGARLLCWSLLAPGPATQDGADGIGFRVRGQGAAKTYLQKWSVSAPGDDTAYMLDIEAKPILYFPVAPGALQPVAADNADLPAAAITAQMKQYATPPKYLLWSAGYDLTFGSSHDVVVAP